MRCWRPYRSSLQSIAQWCDVLSDLPSYSIAIPFDPSWRSFLVAMQLSSRVHNRAASVSVLCRDYTRLF